MNLGRNQHNTMSERQTNAGDLQPNAPSPNFGEEVMTKPQAAEFIKVCPRTLDNHMKRGWVPFSKLPSGAVRFRRSQLIAFLETYQRVSVS